MIKVQINKFIATKRTLIQATYDILAWVIALFVGIVIRYNFQLHFVDWDAFIFVIPILILLQLSVGMLMGLYAGKWRFGSFEEVGSLGKSLIIITILAFLIDATLMHVRPVPLGSILISAALAFLVMATGRWFWRAKTEKLLLSKGDRSKNLLILGAGEAGYQVISAIQRDPNCGYKPIAILDDDREKQNLQLMGVPVVGTTKDLERSANKFSADAILIAMPSISVTDITPILERAKATSLPILAVPQTSALFHDAIDTFDIQNINPEELLGREPILIDDDQVKTFLTGKRVLVTGAGGSIGSEIARQVAKYLPKELILIDRDESGLLDTQLSIEGHGDLMSKSLVLVDIRDSEQINSIFKNTKPEIVFHAAALKHLTLLERYPSEAWKTNVLGTLNLLKVARNHSVSNFINISTDKAADPTCVLGYSKRIAERLTAGIICGGDSETYVSVRFGNVIGSRGSVLDIFKSQIKSGKPLTVTDEEVTRYIMSIPEAVRLVTQAAAIGRHGEVLVLDIGTPVKIYEVAKHFAARQNPPREIIITGLRKGEKLHETLVGENEVGERPFHNKIMHIKVPKIMEDELFNFVGEAEFNRTLFNMTDSAIKASLTNFCKISSDPDLIISDA